MLKLEFFFLLTICTIVNSIDYIICKQENHDFQIDHIEMKDCPDTLDKCPIVLGEPREVLIYFNRVPPLKTMSVIAYAFMYGSLIPIQISPDPCSQLTCPLTAAREFIYQTNVTAMYNIPPTRAYLRLDSEYETLGGKTGNAFCMNIPVSFNM